MALNIQNTSLFSMLIYLQLLGMYPIHTKYMILNLIHYYYGYFLFGSVIAFMVTQFMQLYYIKDNLEELTTNASISFCYIVALAKVYLILFMKPKMFKMVKTIISTEQSILDYGTSECKSLFWAHHKRVKYVTLGFYFLVVITTTGLICAPHAEFYLSGPFYVPFSNGTVSTVIKRPMVLSSWFPFDSNKSPAYEWAQLIQVIVAIIAAAFLGAGDTFIFALLLFCTGQLQILQQKLSVLNERQEILKESNGEIMNFDVTNEISDCISHHNGIIQFVYTLRRWINPVMFLEFLVCSLMLCAIGFQATTIKGFTFKLFVYIEYLSASLIELFMFYWFANEVIIESLKVGVSLWNCNWYTFDTKSKQMLVMIMIRSQRPLIFTAGPFNEMSLATYIGIIKASYTYLTILRQLYG